MPQRLLYAILVTAFSVCCLQSSLPAAAAKQQAPARAVAPAAASDDRNILVYPNPSSDVVYVSFTGFEGRKTELRLLNVIGTVVYRETITELNNRFTRRLDLSRFASGLYYVKIDSDNTSVMRKLVIR
ncbi:T9SS type A sorting domain-containing protein [Hymenobacter latericus]|uniref:T9SS type A sorting domain-containing protein n=1 Tax=Hymenobacter sp. YIM 151858-1 TaxID=2987688 RepID=UPI002225E0C2|nr:T9SS type A sorting domain-containing protein [Hymenobacter sp. YIM 151858-1]UYZ57945.1 T9SS type A sorting domain-containing protein [Hymenobacter sp. YIM 151858-1]